VAQRRCRKVDPLDRNITNAAPVQFAGAAFAVSAD
jgi:hypothetical protein